MNFKYQKQLVSLELLNKSATDFAVLLQFWWQKFEQGKILDCEFAAIYLLYYQWLRCPEYPFMGFSHQPIINNGDSIFELSHKIQYAYAKVNNKDNNRNGNNNYSSSSSSCSSSSNEKELKLELELENLTLQDIWQKGMDHFDFKIDPKQIQKWPLDKPLLEFLNRVEMRGIPRAGIQSILKWFTGEYSLFLLSHVPSAYEVLEFQTQGRRCVTGFIQSCELNQFYEKVRDPMSFLLHDLIHAHHFMANQSQYQMQIAFSKILLQTFATPELQFYYTQDLLFKKDYDYLSSDMNGHSCHLFQTLRSILWTAYDRNPYYSLDSHKTFADFWTHYLGYWNLNISLQFLTSTEKTLFKYIEQSENFLGFLSTLL